MRAAVFLALTLSLAAAEYKDGYADSNGVKIHYVTTGQGPLVVMIHGFPDFWYTWRHQMDALSGQFQVAALDLRGYNLSDKPAGEENYDMRLLLGDVAAVIKHLGREKAIIVGHDWGGAISWQFAFNLPQMVEKLVILNLPHPNGLSRELATNPKQQESSAYARNFQKPDSHKALTAERLAGWVTDPAAKAKYIEAFQRSDFNAMMSYYRRNYPREPYQARIAPQRLNMPVLMIHGLDDKALLAPALNNTWEWLDADLTLVTIPKAGHFVQQDAAALVSKTIKSWLNR
jgi:pimeloyl-ACP methyl ester carboxylesterase